MMQNLLALRDAASPGPWRWQHGDGGEMPFMTSLLFSADGGSAVAIFENRRGRKQTDADAALAALAPDLATRYAEAVKALDDVITDLGDAEYEGEDNVLDEHYREARKVIDSAAKWDKELQP